MRVLFEGLKMLRSVVRSLLLFAILATTAVAQDGEAPKVLTTEETADLFKKIRENPPAHVGDEFAGQAWIEKAAPELWKLRTQSYVPLLKAGPADAKETFLADPLGKKAESAKFAILFESDDVGAAAGELKAGTLISFRCKVEREARRRTDGSSVPIVVAWITKFEVIAAPEPEPPKELVTYGPEKTLDYMLKASENPVAVVGDRVVLVAWLTGTTRSEWSNTDEAYIPHLSAGARENIKSLPYDVLSATNDDQKLGLIFASDDVGREAAKLKPGTPIAITVEFKKIRRAMKYGGGGISVIGFIESFVDASEKPNPEGTP